MKRIINFSTYLFSLLICFTGIAQAECNLSEGRSIPGNSINFNIGEMEFKADCNGDGSISIKCTSEVAAVISSCGKSDRVTYENVNDAREWIKDDLQKIQNKQNSQPSESMPQEKTNNTEILEQTPTDDYITADNSTNVSNAATSNTNAGMTEVNSPTVDNINNAVTANDNTEKTSDSSIDTRAGAGTGVGLSSGSVTGSTGSVGGSISAGMDDNFAISGNSSGGSASSGYVSYSGTAGYGAISCSGGDIFDQLACRAANVGNGLRESGYVIAGFGLIMFSFFAIFGKVKWPLFCTIMFSCFMLSVMVFVIGLMAEESGGSWKDDLPSGSGYGEYATAVQGNVDTVKIKR